MAAAKLVTAKLVAAKLVAAKLVAAAKLGSQSVLHGVSVKDGVGEQLYRGYLKYIPITKKETKMRLVFVFVTCLSPILAPVIKFKLIRNKFS